MLSMPPETAAAEPAKANSRAAVSDAIFMVVLPGG
jgi:hypothetical protein